MAKKKSKRTPTRQPKSSPKSKTSEPVFRVWKLDAPLKDAITEKRNARGQTVREFVAESIQGELSGLVEELAKLGVSIEDSQSITPVRFPMQETTLSALRYASQSSGLDQSQLLVACLRLATRRKRRRSSQ